MENKFVQQIDKIENNIKVLKIAIHEAQSFFENLLNKINGDTSGNQVMISELISEYRSKTMSIWMSNYFLQQEIKSFNYELLINQQHSEIVPRFSVKYSALQNESEIIKILVDHLRNLLEQNRQKFLKFLVAKK
jgi:hypothetical protein